MKVLNLKIKSIIVCSLILMVCFLSFKMSSALAGTLDNQAVVTPEEKEEAQRAISELPTAEGIELVDPLQSSNLPEGQKDKIIVKFINNADPLIVFQEAGINTISIEEVTFSIPPDIGNIGASEKAVGEPLEKESDSWYWFLGKSSKEAPGGYKENKLNLCYKITLTPDITLAEAMDRLKDNPNVEYAIPAYLFVQN